jgi:hypothetical protein
MDASSMKRVNVLPLVGFLIIRLPMQAASFETLMATYSGKAEKSAH